MTELTNAATPIQSGKLHTYAPRLVAFEHDGDPSVPKPHALIFVGGLFDGMLSVPYVPILAESISRLGYTLFSVILSSSYNGFGTGSLGKDVEQIGMCVEYIRKYKRETHGNGNDIGKVVLMGHSTGSQDVLHYLTAPNPLQSPTGPGPKLKGRTRTPIDGAIMQAPVSDREGLGISPEDIEKYRQLAGSMSTEPGSDELMPLSTTKPLFGNAPVSVRRFLSLVSPLSPENPAEDDFFSSDLADAQLAKTFGIIGKNALLTSKSLLAIMSGADEYIGEEIDKELLLQRWASASEAGGISLISSTVPNAKHALGGEDQEQPREYLARQVTKYLAGDPPKL